MSSNGAKITESKSAGSKFNVSLEIWLVPSPKKQVTSKGYRERCVNKYKSRTKIINFSLQ